MRSLIVRELIMDGYRVADIGDQVWENGDRVVSFFFLKLAAAWMLYLSRHKGPSQPASQPGSQDGADSGIFVWR